jgi:hypothetical protein
VSELHNFKSGYNPHAAPVMPRRGVDRTDPEAISRRREAARTAGLASGAVRRRRSKHLGQPVERTGQASAELRYPMPSVRRRDFNVAYGLVNPRPPSGERWSTMAQLKWDDGRETAWKVVRVFERWWHGKGQQQYWLFTNDQILVTLEREYGIRISRRHLQRVRGVLRHLGYAKGLHVKRGQAEPGNKDLLRYERTWTWARAKNPHNVGHASAKRQRSSLTAAAALTADQQQLEVAPPAAADNQLRRFASLGTEETKSGPGTDPIQPNPVFVASPPPAPPRREPEDAARVEAQRRLDFLSLCEEHAPELMSSVDRAALARLRRQLGGGTNPEPDTNRED